MEETIGKTYHEHRRHQDITIANTACAIKKTNNFLFFNKFQYSYTNPGLKIPWCEHYLLYRTNTRNSFSSIIFRSWRIIIQKRVACRNETYATSCFAIKGNFVLYSNVFNVY